MKKTLLIITAISAITFSSCYTVSDIGKLNMVSNRNIDNQMSNYVLIKNYSGGSKKEIKKSIKKTKAATFDKAVDETVRNVAGGEFLMNVHVYSVHRSNKIYFLVEGDVWGYKEGNSFRGFKTGDIVQWKGMGGSKKGKITALTNSEKCMVLENGKNMSIEIKYSKIRKITD